MPIGQIDQQEANKLVKEIDEKCKMLKDLIKLQDIEDENGQPGFVFRIYHDLESSVHKVYEEATTEYAKFLNVYEKAPRPIKIQNSNYVSGTIQAEKHALAKLREEFTKEVLISVPDHVKNYLFDADTQITKDYNHIDDILTTLENLRKNLTRENKK